MATNGIDVQVASPTTTTTRRKHVFISSLAVRLLVALIISWLIVMAFFITSAVSH